MILEKMFPGEKREIGIECKGCHKVMILTVNQCFNNEIEIKLDDRKNTDKNFKQAVNKYLRIINW